MENRMLEITILKTLNRVDTGLKAKTLQAEVEIAMDRPDLTTDEFTDTLLKLEDKALIDQWTNALGDKIYGITAFGKDALKGL